MLFSRNFASTSVFVSIFATSALLLSSFSFVIQINNDGISNNPQTAWAGTFPGPNEQRIFTTISARDDEGNIIRNVSTTTSNSITFEFSSSDTVSQYQCSIDGGAFEDCTSPKTYSNLAAGEHTFRVMAIDAAGNAHPGPVLVWTVQQPSPAQATNDLISDVENLGDDVPQSTKTSIAAPLKEASTILTDDNPNNDKSTCGKLDASTRQINASERRGTLEEQEADDLRTEAEDIRTELDC